MKLDTEVAIISKLETIAGHLEEMKLEAICGESCLREKHITDTLDMIREEISATRAACEWSKDTLAALSLKVEQILNHLQTYNKE